MFYISLWFFPLHWIRSYIRSFHFFLYCSRCCHSYYNVRFQGILYLQFITAKIKPRKLVGNNLKSFAKRHSLTHLFLLFKGETGAPGSLGEIGDEGKSKSRRIILQTIIISYCILIYILASVFRSTWWSRTYRNAWVSLQRFSCLPSSGNIWEIENNPSNSNWRLPFHCLFSLQGPFGETGDVGDIGPPGRTGLTGRAGKICFLQKKEKLLTSSKLLAWNWQLFLRFLGIRGLPGPKGVVGDQGPVGRHGYNGIDGRKGKAYSGT